MANTIIGTGNNVITINGEPITANLSTNVSGFANGGGSQIVYVTTGSWQALPTASLVNVGGLYIDNTNGPGIILVATGSAGQNTLATLSPTDWAWIPWSGSMQVYVTAQISASWVNFIEWSN